MKNLALSFLASITCSTVLFGQASDVDAPSQIRISDVSHEGSGCPTGTVGWDVSPDAQAVTFAFDEFFTEHLGTTEEPRRAKANCKIKMKMTAPAEWQFAMMAIDYRGYASLDQNATGIQRARYRFDNRENVPLGALKMQGPYDNDYVREIDIPLASASWSQCGRTNHKLVLGSSVVIKSRRGATGFLTVDSIDGEITQSWQMAWRKCDRQSGPKFRAVCKGKVENRRGKVLAEFKGRTGGKTRERALQKAKRKTRQKCSRIADRFRRGQCSVQESSCRVRSL